jgi:predicted hydrocarbon binding protein
MDYFQEALTETIGLEGTNAVLGAIPEPTRCPAGSAKDLEKSVDFSCYGAICASVDALFGAAGARRVLHHAGRASFTKLLKNTAAMVGADHPGFSTRSPAAPFAIRMQSIVRLIGMVSDMECSCETDPGAIRFRIISCPECAGRSSAGCICHSMAGMVQAAADWLDATTVAEVAETRCIAQGDPQCEFSLSGSFWAR